MYLACFPSTGRLPLPNTTRWDHPTFQGFFPSDPKMIRISILNGLRFPGDWLKMSTQVFFLKCQKVKCHHFCMKACLIYYLWAGWVDCSCSQVKVFFFLLKVALWKPHCSPHTSISQVLKAPFQYSSHHLMAMTWLELFGPCCSSWRQAFLTTCQRCHGL